MDSVEFRTACGSCWNSHQFIRELILHTSFGDPVRSRGVRIDSGIKVAIKVRTKGERERGVHEYSAISRYLSDKGKVLIFQRAVGFSRGAMAG